jgi:serine/threonine protein kinase
MTSTFAPQGSVNLVDLRYSVSQTRTNFTRLRGKLEPNRDKGPEADFITLICLICEIYRNYGDELAPVRQLHPSREKQYNKGATSTVSHTRISRNSESRIARGTTSTKSELLIVKRPRKSILERQSYALISFMTELRVRTHPPLRAHPNIAQFRGVGWDFEDEAATIPRPLLLEELAPQGALDNFWENWKFVQMNFQSKLDMCRDVAEGLLALHDCGVVHGDVKPENILVFPRRDANDTFILKLTDFGHSVFEHNRLNALPAFTLQWCAPEVTNSINMSFREMKATDCYSYGLVILSIMIGRPFYRDFEDVEGHKQDDTMLQRAIQLIEKEDRENNNSDFDVGVVQSLLHRTIRLHPKRRNMNLCLNIMSRLVCFQLHLKDVNPDNQLKIRQDQWS